jgi:adenine deaminase
MNKVQIKGWFADFEAHEFFFGELSIVEGTIEEVTETGKERLTWKDRARIHPLILPGLVDSHVHIESSMLLPSRFAEQAVRFGTVATVSDPHEIANVLGLDGINLMLKDAQNACLKIHFTAPSCVPATSLETAGAVLNAADLELFFAEDLVVGLGEMMNYPGVLGNDPGVMDKIKLAKKYKKTIDGHAPGLSGDDLKAYVEAGIHTDHECSTLAEAEEKIALGMKVLIREGSSARNFNQLWPLIDKYPEMVMLCTDDYHPDDLVNGHIDRLIRMGLTEGVDFFNLYRCASLNPVSHYHLTSGTLKPGDLADFVIASGLEPFRITATYVNGMPVFEHGKVLAERKEIKPLNVFHASPVKLHELAVKGESGWYRVIRAWDGELLTGSEVAHLVANEGMVQGDVNNDILKIVVVNRYFQAKPAVGWIAGFGLKSGAIVSTIAHDSHNIIAVGTSDEEIWEAINQIIANEGGIAVTLAGKTDFLDLPVAGLMSMAGCPEVGEEYARLTNLVKEMGSTLKAPFMALSFMALLVIPHLKIGDRGLFNCDTFEFTDVKAS